MQDANIHPPAQLPWSGMRPFMVGIALAVAGLSVEVHARPLTLRRADRAIDLALQAELAGDVPGARRALLRLVQTSTSPSSTAGRARIARWLRGLDERATMWSSANNKAQLYRGLIESLAPFGLSRVELVWDAALSEVPQLRAIRDRRARVAIHPDRVIGLDREMNEELHRQLAQMFGRHGLRIEFPDVAPDLPARKSKPKMPPSVGTYWFREPTGDAFELRLEVDATGRRVSGPRVEVEARASYILKAPGPGGASIGRFSRRRRETRRDEVAARRFALHQVGYELAQTVVVQMWVECLREAARPPNAAFDSEMDVRSN